MSTEMTPAMRRSVLIATLRDKSMWPEGFVWDYTWRCSCAIGLAERLFGFLLQQSLSTGGYSKLGLSCDDIRFVFVGLRNAQREVTPEMVADRLEGIHNAIQARASTTS